MSTKQERFDGNGKTYRIDPQVKAYTLKDFGFIESSPGKFRYERHLAERAEKHAPLLKVSISNDFSKLKISTTTANGLKRINLSQAEDLALAQTIADSLLFQMVESGILEEV